MVGGGIAGLTAAYRLSAGGADVVVLEAGEDIGGKVRSVEVGGLRLEAGPDSLVARKPWAADLCRELGLGDDLAAPASPTAHVLTRRGLLPLPSGPFGISTNPIELARWRGLSLSGRVRAAADLVRRPRAGGDDESLGALVRRHLGDEAAEALVAPLLGGLLAGDVDRLSVLATFPELAAWERRHGSLIRGARAARSSTRGRGPSPVFLRLRGGLERLTAALGDSLGARIRTGARAEAIDGSSGALRIRVRGGAEVAADSVVLATPAYATADLVEPLAPASAAALRRVSYASSTVVLLVYGEGKGSRVPRGSGFLAPRGTLEMTACTFVSRKWPEEAFGDRAVVRCFVDGEGAEDPGHRADRELVARVSRRLEALFGLPEAPRTRGSSAGRARCRSTRSATSTSWTRSSARCRRGCS